MSAIVFSFNLTVPLSPSLSVLIRAIAVRVLEKRTGIRINKHLNNAQNRPVRRARSSTVTGERPDGVVLFVNDVYTLHAVRNRLS